MTKDYENWHDLKLRLNVHPSPPTFKEREIWWCSVGMNVGFEIFGKGEIFTRPVLILRKFNAFTFLGIPMSTKLKGIPTHYKITFKGKEVSLLMDQIRTLDSRRLANRYGYLTEKQYEEVQITVRNMI